MKDELLKKERSLDKKIKLKYQNRNAKLDEIVRLNKAIKRIEDSILELQTERAEVHGKWIAQNEPNVPHKFKAGDIVVNVNDNNMKKKILGLNDDKFYECIDYMRTPFTIAGHVLVSIADVDENYKLLVDKI